MPRNGSGVYSLPSGINPVAQDTTITSNWANTTLTDLASALTQSLARDGQTVPTANLPMGNFRHTGVSDPSSRNQYNTLKYAQDGLDTRLVSVAGSNAITASLPGGLSALVAGMEVQLIPIATNTGDVTININSLGAKPVLRPDGLQFGNGQLVSGIPYFLVYDGTNFRALSSPATSGTVTSVQIANATGISFSGGPITTNGTFTPALSANLQAWSGLATSAKQNQSANLDSWSAIATSTKLNTANPAFTGTMTGATITVSGVVTGSNCVGTCDTRAKDNIADAKVDTHLADAIYIYDFTWRINGEPGRGPLAQQVQVLAPQYVFDIDGMLRVDKAGLALEMVVGLAKRVRELEDEIRRLTGVSGD